MVRAPPPLQSAYRTTHQRTCSQSPYRPTHCLHVPTATTNRAKNFLSVEHPLHLLYSSSLAQPHHCACFSTTTTSTTVPPYSLLSWTIFISFSTTTSVSLCLFNLFRPHLPTTLLLPQRPRSTTTTRSASTTTTTKKHTSTTTQLPSSGH